MQQSSEVFPTLVIPPGSYDRLGLRASLGMPPIGDLVSYSELADISYTFNIRSLEKMAYLTYHSFKWNDGIYLYEIDRIGNICCICVKK